MPRYLQIDHQAGTMLGVQELRLDPSRSNVLALAETAKVHNQPDVLTDRPAGPPAFGGAFAALAGVSQPDGDNG